MADAATTTTDGEATSTGTDSTDTTTSTDGTGDGTEELGEAGKRALDAERTARKAAEKQARDNAKELEKLRQQHMTDSEKALNDAREEGRTEARGLFGGKLVDAEVRAATAGRGVDAEALLEGLDRTKFLGDDGEPDRDAIVAWLDRVAPKSETEDEETKTSASGYFDLGQGTRSGGTAGADSPEAFVKTLTDQLRR